MLLSAGLRCGGAIVPADAEWSGQISVKLKRLIRAAGGNYAADG
jgi:hypothetical protein